MLVSEEYDKNLKPLGTKPGSFQVPVDATLLGDSVEQQVSRPEEDTVVAAQQLQDLIDEEGDGDSISP